jgi:hypothetical protein
MKVPFFTNEPDTSGSISVNGESLEFEWSQGGRAAFALELSKIKTITYKHGFLASSINIRPREEGDLAGFPVTHGAVAILKVARRDRERDREAAEQMAKDVSFSLMDSQLDDMLDITDL